MTEPDFKKFEEATKVLLTLAGWRVETEQLIGYKKVDLLAQREEFGKTVRLAVECKDWSDALSQSEINAIYTNYRTLIDTYRIDQVLIVTRRPLAPSAVTLVKETRALHHRTLNDLQNEVIDFTTYLVAAEKDIRDDGLAEYYITPFLSDDTDLEAHVERWMADGGHPLAILGGYGMGKTTFARHFAATLAQRHRTDANTRIPLIVKLAEISAEQSLEGLLGRVFTAGSVKNFQFSVFMELNRTGRFVIFLDGFDEMKHALSTDQLQHNFRELNRLVDGASKIILLGRPSAFLSDAEHQRLLHGKGATKDLHWPDYEELHLRPFKVSQVQEFLTKYIAYLQSAHKLPEDVTAERLTQQLNALPKTKLADLATRPVQLRLLAEVLPQWDQDLNQLTTARLYSRFIDLVIEREQGKLTRQRFTQQERRSFARALAYWLWTEQETMLVEGARIPPTLFPSARNDETSDGIRREMLAACFLERKIGGPLYFPHRSFQEFLVAEQVVHSIRTEQLDLKTAAQAVTRDVAEFLNGLVEETDRERLLATIKRANGAISEPLARTICSNALLATMQQELTQRRPNRWSILLLALDAHNRGAEVAYLTSLAQAITTMDRSARTVALFAMLHVATTSEHITPLVAGLTSAARSAYADYKETVRRGKLELRPFGAANLIEEKVLRQLFVQDVGVGTLDTRQALTLLANELRRETMIAEWGADERIREKAPIPLPATLQWKIGELLPNLAPTIS